LVKVLQPFDVVDDGDGSGFDAAMLAIGGVVAADGGVLEILGFLLGDEELDIIAQRALVALCPRSPERWRAGSPWRRW
jgi:hypothetical protein